MHECIPYLHVLPSPEVKLLKLSCPGILGILCNHLCGGAGWGRLDWDFQIIIFYSKFNTISKPHLDYFWDECVVHLGSVIPTGEEQEIAAHVTQVVRTHNPTRFSFITRYNYI